MNLTLRAALTLWVLLLFSSPAVLAQEAEGGGSTDSAETSGEATAAVEEDAAGFPPDQIEQLAAPVALYPDALLAQVLMAATYPLDVVQAARWVGDHGDLEGEALEQAVLEESWDPSVQALAFFPSVLTYMSDNLDWTQDLGEAFLGQQDEVMNAIQNLRQDAQEAGNLVSNEQQRVEEEGDTIVIQPAEPEVVYVPSYNPSEVYSQPPPSTTYYPDTYNQASSSSDSLVNFGVGALVGGLLTAAILWDNDDDYYRGVYYGGPGRWGAPGYWGRPGYWDNGGWRRPVAGRDVNINTGDITINKGIGGKPGRWEHRPEHRGNINYKNKKAKKKYAKDLNKRPVDRDSARGRPGDVKRDLKRPGNKGGKPANLAGGKRPDNRDAARKPTKKRDVDLKRPDNKKVAKKSAAKPAQRPAAKPQQRDVKAPQKKMAKKPASNNKAAFKPSKGNMARQSSNRGAKSAKRSGNKASRGGGKAKRNRG